MDINQFLHSPQAFLDLIILLLGFLLGVGSRSRWFVIFFQVSLLMVRMAKWYYDTHPDAKKRKHAGTFDEKIDEIYHKHLAKHDLENYDDLIGYEITEIKKN